MKTITAIVVFVVGMMVFIFLSLQQTKEFPARPSENSDPLVNSYQKVYERFQADYAKVCQAKDRFYDLENQLSSKVQELDRNKQILFKGVEWVQGHKAGDMLVLSSGQYPYEEVVNDLVIRADRCRFLMNEINGLELAVKFLGDEISKVERSVKDAAKKLTESEIRPPYSTQELINEMNRITKDITFTSDTFRLTTHISQIEERLEQVRKTIDQETSKTLKREEDRFEKISQHFKVLVPGYFQELITTQTLNPKPVR